MYTSLILGSKADRLPGYWMYDRDAGMGYTIIICLYIETLIIDTNHIYLDLRPLLLDALIFF